MKKRNFSLMLLTGLSVLALAACDMDKDDDHVQQSNSQKVTTHTKKAAITEEKAKAIALKDAGFAEGDVKNLTIKLETEDGQEVYDIEFDKDSKEYSYSIDSQNGDIVEKSSDNHND
ncbi:PepSY domain-containing protein [Streptococcus iniae]|uniref:PepSY domain-containing protein n=2 Tax=Streptococcus iniae TaxID=1346 RepID=A0ABM5QJB8_STRIN|nr:PepSY domain-containing protein [Streptococcus iniae]AHY16377.1 hypothetical protein DQ08_07950 [Streptococcus iniae]AHY18240.1 hypothetical protein DW64_07935 [Streptococcus iniae]AJG26524.1 hypothetical protein SI82_08060 [Streptococcus iniae]APD32399.1 hypothetical protein BMF34_07970 [Streptococcus iniae]ASL35365.1 lipoprotein [Streptococcus iniae]